MPHPLRAATRRPAPWCTVTFRRWRVGSGPWSPRRLSCGCPASARWAGMRGPSVLWWGGRAWGGWGEEGGRFTSEEMRLSRRRVSPKGVWGWDSGRQQALCKWLSPPPHPETPGSVCAAVARLVQRLFPSLRRARPQPAQRGSSGEGGRPADGGLPTVRVQQGGAGASLGPRGGTGKWLGWGSPSQAGKVESLG